MKPTAWLPRAAEGLVLALLLGACAAVLLAPDTSSANWLEQMRQWARTQPTDLNCEPATPRELQPLPQ